MNNTQYQILLPQFEGPFDLLLFFIERDELDIYDIPIAGVTDDFLAYIRQMQDLNMEVASEFILVAGTLMRIKSKMLLPRPELDEKGEEIDPRKDLVERLLEYKKYKSVLEELEQLEESQAKQLTRGFVAAELKGLETETAGIEELESISPYRLLKIFQKVWEKHQYEMTKPRHVIQQYPYKIEEVREEIKQKIQLYDKLEFVPFVLRNPDRMYFVFSFLAILELTQEKVIRISAGVGFNEFWIVKRVE